MFLLVFLVAILLSVTLVPILMKHAPRYGFIDNPDPRKVHVAPIPRTGGLAMVVGSLVPMLVWLPLDLQMRAFLAAILVITVFGMWDDRADLDYRLKFAGQVVAALLVTVVGGVVIRDIPFGPSDGLPDLVAIPLTVLFFVGITNAVNLADGLDGLASGVALLSAGVVALLASLAEGDSLLLIALAVSGSICGFLRYNTHPASVFMGDTGSQFLGFSLGFMVVNLTQEVNSAVSPMLLILILGLPILDTLSVIARRLRERRSPFMPDRNHLHHKLLASGLHHYEAVAAIYIFQGLFVGTALFLRYESDWVLVVIYLALTVALAVFIKSVRRLRAYSTPSVNEKSLDGLLRVLRHHVVFQKGPLAFLNVAIPTFLIGGAVGAAHIPRDFGIVATLAFVLLAARLLIGYRAWFLFLRLLIFVSLAFVAYLLEMGPLDVSDELIRNIEFAYFGLLGLAAVLVVRCRLNNEFKITPMDFLVILAMLSMGVFPADVRETYHLVPVVVKLVILFYGAELVLKTMTSRWTLLPLSSLAGLAVIAMRGLAS